MSLSEQILKRFDREEVYNAGIETDGVFRGTYNKYNHPVAQRVFWGLQKPYLWQEAVWDAVWRVGSQVPVAVCNEGGKGSMLIPGLALAFANAFPGAKVVITSASSRQLEEQVAPGLKQAVARHPKWKYINGEVSAPSIDGLPESKVIWFVTTSAERFEGFHPQTYVDNKGRTRYCPLMIIVDEAKSVKPEFFDAIHRCSPDHTVYLSSTGEDSGDFYDACANLNGLWTTEWPYNGQIYRFAFDGIDFTQCEHLTKGAKLRSKLALLKERGENDPLVCSELLARFFKSGEHRVFNEGDIQAIRNAMGNEIRQVGRQRRAACDIAPGSATGGDELTFQVRRGNCVEPVVAWRQDFKTPPSKTAEKYVRLFKHHGLTPEEITIDAGGAGALIVNEIEKLGYTGINRYVSQRTARDSKSFVNRYSEDHWKLKGLLHDECLNLPKDDKLLEQARKRNYILKNDDSNRIRIESKEDARRKRGEESPDRLDTLVMLCCDIEPLPTVKELRNNAPICGTPEEYLKHLKEQEENSGSSITGWGGE